MHLTLPSENLRINPLNIIHLTPAATANTFEWY